ncbi:MAG TPA: twin-arginine translocase TatA/TatE family subunit [Rhizomicrobium sp.]|nr:twin-arginine translocase TatA/TatE family subunit [Rhizomicrobium sp.]
MGALSIWHILILAVVGLLLFGGRGKISDLMGDVGKGIRSFRQGLNDSDDQRHLPDRRDEKDSAGR